MLDLDWNAKMVTKSAKLSNNNKQNAGGGAPVHLPTPLRLGDFSTASPSSCADYEHYFRLPQLTKLWSSKDFPNWENEGLLKPALQALEITFRFISIVLSDPRPYVNRREWKRRLGSLTTHQIEIIAIFCEEDGDGIGTAPIVDLSISNGVLARNGSISAEVWKLPAPGAVNHVVSRTSEASLLPRLAAWQKSEDVASKILFSIECEMRRCPYTFGLGEPNLTGKPNLEYDLVCKPSDLHSLKKIPSDHLNNYENHTLFTIHQILESWIYTSHQLLERISKRIDAQDFENAASDCWLLERIWKLLAEIEDLHLMMDIDDFLRLKNQLAIQAENEAFCFRSKRLMEISTLSKDLKHKVPAILGVDVDPKGGPRIQEAAMKLYHGHKQSDFGKIHLVQAFQAVESALKRFFFSYRQLIGIVMGTLAANGNRAMGVCTESVDSLSQIFNEPTYFPSLDAAKTFLGDFWQYEHMVVRRNES